MTYYFKRILNNNAVVAETENSDDVILLGKAIGIKCRKSTGYPVNQFLIERVFENKQDGNWKYVEQLINEIPYEYFDLVDHVIKKAGEELQYDFKDRLTLILVDHISFSVKRYREKEIIPNPLLSEIQQFFPDEFHAAMHSIDYINKELNVVFDANEASFIAFHYINAMSSNSQSENKHITNTLSECVDIVESHFGVSLKRDNYYFYRFISHIKYFLDRLIRGDPNKGGEKVLTDFIHKQYQNEWNCAEKLKQLISKEYEKNITEDEVAYLTLHLATVLKNNER